MNHPKNKPAQKIVAIDGVAGTFRVTKETPYGFKVFAFTPFEGYCVWGVPKGHCRVIASSLH